METNLPGLARLIRFVGFVRSQGDSDRKNRVLSDDELAYLRALDLVSLKESILAAPARLFTTGERHDLDGNAIRRGYAETLDDLIRMQSIGTIWKSSQRGVERLNGARLLFKHAGRNGVILDAAASNDPIYELLGERVKLLPAPDGIRDYSNVQFNVSRGHRVGKEHLTQNCQEEWARLRKTLQSTVGRDRNVLAICHKDSVPALEAEGFADSNLMITNWGAVDGRNDWSDCDCAVLFGLPYLDDVVPTNLFLACTGTISDTWFEGERAFGQHTDIRKALKSGFKIRSIIQALNRVRCRRVVDGRGGCAPTDIYLMLPSGSLGDHIISAITAQMPGVQVIEWGVSAALPKIRRVPTLKRLVECISKLALGTYSKSAILKASGISKRSFERLSIKLQDSSSAAYLRMAELNTTYTCAIGTKEATFIIG